MSVLEEMERLQLQTILDGLNVPEQRRNDMGWLNRNLLINNRGPEATEAARLVRSILKRQGNKTIL